MLLLPADVVTEGGGGATPPTAGDGWAGETGSGGNDMLPTRTIAVGMDEGNGQQRQITVRANTHLSHSGTAENSRDLLPTAVATEQLQFTDPKSTKPQPRYLARPGVVGVVAVPQPAWTVQVATWAQPALKCSQRPAAT